LNIVLTATNLLPVLPMDGGRILSAIVSRASGRPALAMRLIAVLTEITGWLLLVSGLAAALTNGLTVGIVWLLIGVLVLREGRSERRKLSEYGAGPQHPPRHYQAHGWRGVATTIETHQSGLPGPGR
jgi:hypothetical protein